MKKHEEYTTISLNRPENLVLEDMIRPELPFFVPVRRDDGTVDWKIKTGSSIIRHLPAIYYFIHVLLERQHSDVDSLRCRFARDFVEMFSRDIEPLKSKNDFRFIWGILRSLQVIEVHDDNRPNKYRKSAKAYFFRLTDTYLNSKIIQHQVLVKKKIADRLNRKWDRHGHEEFRQVDLSTVTVNKHLAHQYNALHDIMFDSEAAKEHLERLLSEKEITPARYNTGMICINSIINGRIKITHSVACHRYYTAVTSMPKELRQFIKDGDGNILVELDFGSFNAFVVYKIISEISPEYNSDLERKAFENELDLYKWLLNSSDFYVYFREMFLPDENLTRNQTKEIVLKHWFNGRIDSRNRHRKHLLKRLPRISEIIDSLKAERYENFSNMAMRIESRLVNDIIYRKFIEMHPDAVMYTIFDSFLVERRYASQLHSMMLEEGGKYFNVNCIVRVK